jgi:hypothetical protein
MRCPHRRRHITGHITNDVTDRLLGWNALDNTLRFSRSKLNPLTSHIGRGRRLRGSAARDNLTRYPQFIPRARKHNYNSLEEARCRLRPAPCTGTHRPTVSNPMERRRSTPGDLPTPGGGWPRPCRGLSDPGTWNGHALPTPVPVRASASCGLSSQTRSADRSAMTR